VCIKNKEIGQNKCTRKELLTILRDVANVRNLELSGDFLGFSERKTSRLELNNLKELTLNGTANSSRVSKILKNVKVQKLTLNPKRWGKFDKHFESWLMRQDRLEELYIQDQAIKFFFKEFPAGKMQIQLRKLSLEVRKFYGRHSMINFQENIINFCRSQKALQEVDLSVRFPSHIGHGIVASLLESNSLKKLKVFNIDIPVIESRVNDTLEDLCIEYSISTFTTQTWRTLEKLTQLKHLEINFRGFAVRQIIENCSGLSQLMTIKLRKITIYPTFAEHDAFRQINLPSLRKITFDKIYVKQLDWTLITSKCPLVESLTLDHFILDQGSAGLICEQWKNLKMIDLGYGLYLEEVFPAILNCSSLKVLKVVEKMNQQLQLRLGEAVAPFEIIVKNSVLDKYEVRALTQQFAFLEDRSLYFDNFSDN
jgi:hypothetical protein